MTQAQAEALERLWPRYGVDLPGSGMPLDLARLFGAATPVVFEIGFGNGDHLLARAVAEPDRGFLGAEVHRPGVGRLLLLAEKAGITNLRVIDRDAVEVLGGQLPDASLAEVVVYFPDPWHKKRHHKRRLIQPAFVDLVARKLAPGGVLRLATDWEPYAEQMLTVCKGCPALHNRAADGGYGPRPSSRPVTRFEARGERLGHAVLDLAFERIGG